MTDWSLLHARIHQTVQAHKTPLLHSSSGALIPTRARLLVAVSGGQDSLCLLKLMADLQPKWRWQIEAVHCDHRWRPDSADNAAFVVDLAQQWGISCRVVQAETVPGSEAAARHWRYGVFESLALELSCSHVVTGHTATDRAETLLYNLIRGSGADGMQAMTWLRSLSPEHPEISLVRPLLEVTRAETAAFCQSFNIPIWEDSTNQDRAYARNRLRLDVMPYLRENFNPNVERSLAQTAEILAAEVEFLDQLAEALYRQVILYPTLGGPWQIRRTPLKKTPLALKRRVLRRVLREVLSVQVTFEQVEKLVHLIDAPQRSQSDPFPGGAIARVEQDLIIIA
ncbi:MAG: tRNA lysidine(34) synthetase TilS [Cyanobacteria bacterium Co-bin8]|nr:tRNA lysidine(34) synthetase TilS [Cyanobacteria bacterium Co-bin8]